jgi:hypothetical protein
MKHSAKPEKHSAKALPSVALGKEGSTHNASAKPSLPSTFSRALGKEVCRVPESTRQRKAAVTATSDGDGVFADTRQRSYLCRVSARQHSAKNPPGRVPMSGSLPSARFGTRRTLCRVPETLHSAKNLYRYPGLGSLPSAMVLTLGKEPLCRV